MEEDFDSLCRVTEDDLSSIEWDETGAKYSQDGKILMRCQVSFEGIFIVPNGVEIIANQAFKDCINLVSIEFPSSVKVIGRNAFSNCQKLSCVNIPSSVVKICGWAFSGCISLTRPVFCNNTFVRLPIDYKGAYSVPWGITKIADGAFEYCVNLTSVDLPDNVNYIGDLAFRGCVSLTKPLYNSTIFAFLPFNFQGEYHIPYGIKEISGGAFRHCTELTSIVMPDSLTKIGSWSFMGCSQLAYVTIPDSVKEIGVCAFKNCVRLSSIVMPDNIIIGDNAFAKCGKEDILLYSKDNKKLIRCPSSHKGVFEIPYGVKNISANAFKGCRGITSIIIPDSVTCIGNNAFSDCLGLKSVDLPDSVTTLGTDVFAGCSNIERPIYNKTVFAYFPVRFIGAYSIPYGIIAIGGSCFKNCKGLTKIDLPEGLLSIRKEAFAGCSNLKDIKLPSSLMVIRYGAFADCSSLETINIPNGISKISMKCFQGCSNLRYVMFPETLCEIESEAFSKCVNLESLDFPEGLTSIGLSAFEGCKSLTYVSMPKSITSINESTFMNCSNFKMCYTSKLKIGPYLINGQVNKPLLYDDRNLTNNFIYINEYFFSSLKTNKLYHKRKMLCPSWNGLAYRRDNSIYIINPSPFVVIKLVGSVIGITLLRMIWQYKDKLERFSYYYDGSEISTVNLDNPEFFSIFSRAFPQSYMSSIIHYRNSQNAIMQDSLSKDSIFRQWLMKKKDNNYQTIRFNEKVSALSVRSSVVPNNINKPVYGETSTIIEGEIFTLKSNMVGYCRLVFESKETAKATIIANVPMSERLGCIQSIKEYLESNLLHKRSNSRKNGEIRGIKVIFVNHNNFENWKADILNDYFRW